MKIIHSFDEIPKDMSDSEAAEFWSTHALSEELLEASILEDNDDEPPKRVSKSISIRLDQDLLDRIKKLATIRQKGYQSLIKEFLIERLYEEEKKAEGRSYKEEHIKQQSVQSNLPAVDSEESEEAKLKRMLKRWGSEISVSSESGKPYNSDGEGRGFSLIECGQGSGKTWNIQRLLETMGNKHCERSNSNENFWYVIFITKEGDLKTELASKEEPKYFVVTTLPAG
ncbi:CopG family antitoxin [Paenibacillus koleovorans]|uniref:CopG family antitoxin n=1 Tax=Paenibacillus koleovorans TaxID=121608 RepID=UPI000FD8C05D|nr:CopG family antitoxin [Paenibacillus koleovorans]